MAIKKTNASPTVMVPPRPAEGTNQLRDIKPLVEVPIGPWPWIIGGILLALAALLGWAWLRRRNRLRPEPPPVVIPPHVRAKQKLEQALGLLSDPRLFCIAVSDAARLYLEERFNLRAPERTTDEFLHELQNTTHLLPDQKITLAEFLQRCDLVKFAKNEPTETELRALHRIADRLVDETMPTVSVTYDVPAAPGPHSK